MHRLLIAVVLAGLVAPVHAQDTERPTSIDAGLVSSLSFRSIGPALMSGRVADIAVDPCHPNRWYVAIGSGNLWKTVNAGTTWTPIFDGYSVYSTGCLTIDPNDCDTLWLGTGEAVGGRHSSFGDGVYRSLDGGATFEHLGLKQTEHIAKIVVDPRDSNVVFVAAQGPLWSPGGERGLYQTTDGGQSWKLLLAAGPYTGVTDVVMHPENPDILFAATHQRHRTVAALLNGGPESGVHKSTDGGRTWRQLQGGLPSGDVGKIALALSPQDPEVVYATIELPGRTGGFWRSENGGEAWNRQSDYVSGGTGPHYYQEIWADPHREGVIYQANVVLGRSEDGGRTWQGIGNNNKHVDNHAVAFHPTDPDFLLVGCDGGLYKSYDRGETYAFTANLPLTQFYKVDVDYDWPVYHVVGGTQDNNTQYGPTRTLTDNGIRNADWRITIGGDGHDCAIDPDDPNILYCESQQGYLRRFDRRTGESIDIRPQPEQGAEDLRFNWDAPIHISPHSHTRLYFGSNKLHRSDDRGDSWRAISPDLSRQRDRFTLEIMGRVQSIDATWDLLAMSQHGNITSVSESPLQEGLIYVGTDDGLIHVTEDSGESWRRVERIWGVPEFAFVNDIKADLHDVNTVYACLDNHKEGDYRPFLIKSTDRGRTWTSLVGDLPDRHLVWRIIQDHVQPRLMFLATEFGIFTTLDGGERWLKMSGGLPTISVRDLEIQRRENDLVAATFGRSFYVLDDYTPLRHLSAERLEKDIAFFPIKNAWLYEPDDVLGGRVGSQGDSVYSANNPPYGAVFTFHVKEGLKTKKSERQEKESKLAESGAGTPYPGWAALKAEDREESPRFWLEIRDSAGRVVNRVSGPTGKGLHRVTWNLRHASVSGGFGGPRVTPGRYTVQAYRRADDQSQKLGEAQSFEVQAIGTPSLPPQDRGEVLAFLQDLDELQRAVGGAQSVIDEAIGQVQDIKQMIDRTVKLDPELLDEARRIELALTDAREALSGDPTKPDRFAMGSPSILGRLRNAYFGSFGQSYGPTGTHRRQAQIAREEYGATIDGVRQLIEDDLEQLKTTLDEAGAPWTRGRKIPVLRR